MNVFISYSEANKTLAQNLRSSLVKEGHSVPNFATDIAAGSNWHKELGKALEQSEAMVVLLTPESVNSSSVRSDIDYALSNPRFRNRLIPVMVRPTQAVPWILKKLNRKMIRASNDLSQTAREIASALHATVPAAAAK